VVVAQRHGEAGNHHRVRFVRGLEVDLSWLYIFVRPAEPLIPYLSRPVAEDLFDDRPDL
jgi:hypothetical protein